MISVYEKPFVQQMSANESLSNVESITYGYSEHNNDLVVDIIVKYLDDSVQPFKVYIDKSLFADQILTVALLKYNIQSKFHSIVFDPKYNQVYGFYSRGSDFTLFNAASIWIPSNENKPIIIINHVRFENSITDISNINYTEMNFIEGDPQATLLSLVPEAKLKKDRWFLKKKYIQNLLDPYDSIAYLEGQVDVLSKVVNLLIEKTGLDVGEYKNILDDIDKNTVIDVKTLDKIRTEILEDKAKVRDIQKIYYRAKNGE